MPLQDQLDEVKRRFAATDSPIAPEHKQAMVDFGAWLTSAGLEKNVLSIGTVFPDFALHDATGSMLHRDELLKRGPAAILFYRGLW